MPAPRIRAPRAPPGRRRSPSMSPFQLVAPCLRENRWTILLGVCCLVAVDFMQLWIPRVVKWAVDALTTATGPAPLGGYAARIMALAVGIGVFRYIWRRCLIGTSRKVERDLRQRLLEHLQKMEPAFFDRHPTGSLMAHATNDINHVRMATGMGMVALTDAVVLGTAAIGFMAYIDWRLTILVLVPMPLIAFGTRLFSRRMHQRYQQVQAAFASLTETVREHFSGIRVVKAYTLAPAAIRRAEASSEQYVQQNLKLVRITGSFFPMMVLFSNISLALVLLLGGRATVAGRITPGDFVAFISYIGLITWPMMALGWVMNLIQRGKASLERLAAIFNTAPAIADAPGALPLADSPRRIAFQDVVLTYAGGRQALSDVNLHFEAGRSYGIVGPPGSGKTSLIRLIARLYEPTAGTVAVDGRPLGEIRLADLRRRIAFVPQEPFIFAGTLGDNITMGQSVSPAKLAAAIADAGLESMVARLTAGLDTVVGERGVMLSGGQKQRVSLARALLSDRPILLLDDPISQLDTVTGRRVIEALRRRAAGRLVIIVSHRMAAVRWTDRVVVMENGTVSAVGPHDAVSAQNAYYRNALRIQAPEDNGDAN
ncbi:MAG: ABC transporter ATP-binding protein [Deltaproteobacteria bacterium]|nr:ABC transporter ATP-binding protein [Deltaproteobacteria bacterium]